MLISKPSLSSTAGAPGHKSLSRKIAVLTMVAALTISVATPMQASAKSGVAVRHGSSSATDISAARRHYSRGRGNAAALAAFAGVVGTIGAIAATQSRNDDYYGGGPGYGYGPGYYAGPPAYYGGYGPYRGYGGGHGYDNSRNQTW